MSVVGIFFTFLCKMYLVDGVCEASCVFLLCLSTSKPPDFTGHVANLQSQPCRASATTQWDFQTNWVTLDAHANRIVLVAPVQGDQPGEKEPELCLSGLPAHSNHPVEEKQASLLLPVMEEQEKLLVGCW